MVTKLLALLSKPSDTSIPTLQVQISQVNPMAPYTATTLSLPQRSLHSWEKEHRAVETPDVLPSCCLALAHHPIHLSWSQWDLYDFVTAKKQTPGSLEKLQFSRSSTYCEQQRLTAAGTCQPTGRTGQKSMGIFADVQNIITHVCLCCFSAKKNCKAVWALCQGYRGNTKPAKEYREKAFSRLNVLTRWKSADAKSHNLLSRGTSIGTCHHIFLQT